MSKGLFSQLTPEQQERALGYTGPVASGDQSLPKAQRRGKLLDLVHFANPILRAAAPEFDFENPPVDPVELAYDLTETMLTRNGVGLAACQVGLPYRVFAIRTNPVLVFFNPRLVDQSVEHGLLEEGCLTFPGLVVKVKRSDEVRVRFTMPNGFVETKKFTGITSRVVQHEYDHLEGMTFFDRLDRYHRDQAWRRWKKIQRRGK